MAFHEYQHEVSMMGSVFSEGIAAERGCGVEGDSWCGGKGGLLRRIGWTGVCVVPWP